MCLEYVHGIIFRSVSVAGTQSEPVFVLQYSKSYWARSYYLSLRRLRRVDVLAPFAVGATSPRAFDSLARIRSSAARLASTVALSRSVCLCQTELPLPAPADEGLGSYSGESNVDTSASSSQMSVIVKLSSSGVRGGAEGMASLCCGWNILKMLSSPSRVAFTDAVEGSLGGVLSGLFHSCDVSVLFLVLAQRRGEFLDMNFDSFAGCIASFTLALALEWLRLRSLESSRSFFEWL